MAVYNPLVDEYIEKSAEFAVPILTHLRQLVHHGCTPAEEAMKWSFPCFMYNGSILCNMAAFKQHCTFGFWLGAAMQDEHKILEPVGERTSMGHLGQIKQMTDLPKDKIIIDYIKQAMLLTDKGIKIPKKKSEPVKLEIPVYISDTLKQTPAAFSFFEKLSPSQKKEYVVWIDEAKSDATRNKRMTTAVEWLQEGKKRHWKYENC